MEVSLFKPVLFPIFKAVTDASRIPLRQSYQTQTQRLRFIPTSRFFTTHVSLQKKQNNLHSQEIVEKTKKLANQYYEKSQKLKYDTYSRSKELREKTLQKSHQLSKQSHELREKTLEKSVQFKENAKELKENINKILPADFHENVYTLPNFLTVTRLISAPIVGYLIVQGQVTWALSLFVYSCVTDFVDGYIARKYNLQSVVGGIIDPLADKALMIICTACLAKAGAIPLYIASLILGRDIILTVGAFVIRWMSLPPPKTFTRYWDFSLITVEVHPTLISKINTGLQMLYIGSMMIKPVFLMYASAHCDPAITTLFLNYVQGLEWTVAFTTLWSGLSYAFNRDAIKLFKKK